MFSPKILELARRTIAALTATGQTIVTAESCTGGLISGALTAIPGSSEAVFGGFVTYANAAKRTMTGVSPALIKEHGAVSEAVVRAMAEGARRKAGTDFSVAVTGIAGPGGGSRTKPAGLVHIAVAGPDAIVHNTSNFGDTGRDHVRQATVEAALLLVLEQLAARTAVHPPCPLP